MRGYFAQVRRAGFDIGLSAGKLTKAMVEVLSQWPREATPSKEVVVQHLGLLGQMTKTRDINAAWNRALVVEMFGGIRGMGFLLVSLANAFRAPELFAATALVSLLSVGVVLALERLNRRLGHWR